MVAGTGMCALAFREIPRDRFTGRHPEAARTDAGTSNGRGGGIRTHDPLPPRQVRYQAALRPDW